MARVVSGTISEVEGVLARLATAVDDATTIMLEGCDSTDLRRIVRSVTRQAARLEGVRARAVQVADASGVVESSGASSGAAWLAAATGGTTAAAARTATLGAALDRVPSLAEAVRAGAITSEHAGSLARAADRGVLDDDQLRTMVDEARVLPAGVFSRVVRDTEARTDQRRLRRDEQAARDRRTARWWWSDDGMLEGRFVLDAIGGQVVATALDGLVTVDTAEVPDELRRSTGQRRADAVVAVAEVALSHGSVPAVGGVRPHVTVAVPVTMMARTDDEAEQAGAVGTLPDGTVVSAEVARRLACDATVRRLVLAPDGEPLDVGRATRTWSPAQRTAVIAVDGGCRGPACDRPAAWTELHHIVWWRHDGATAVDNGIALCGRCHDLVHHHAWTVRLDPTTRIARWTGPGGRAVTTRPRGPAARRRR